MTAGPIQHVALASVAVGAVALLVLLPRVFLRTDPVLRYRLLAWFLPVAVLALPAQVAVTALAPEWARLRLRPRADAQPRVQHWSTWLRAVDVDLDDHTPARAASPDGRAAAPEAETVESAQPGLLPRLLNALPAIYITGVILALVILVARLRKTLRVMRRCRPVADEDTLTLWNEVVGEFGMRNRVRLLECEGLSAPACWGPWRPVVIVPTTDDTAIDKRLLSCALRHELIHLRRRDPLHKLLQLFLTIGFWFHPLVWLYCLALDRDRELSCDALVVRKTRKPRTYALALLAYCERATHPARMTPFTAFGSIVKLQRRLDMIRHAQAGSKRIWTRLMLAGVLLGIVGITTAHMTMAAAMNSNHVATPPRGDRPSRPDQMDIRILKADSGAIRMAAIDALTEGREPGTVYRRWRHFAEQRDPALRGRSIPPGTILTDQETVVSAWNARHTGNVLEADTFSMNLPEGSALQAVVEGDQIIISLGKEETRMTIRNGSIRIVDENGVARAVARPSDGAPMNTDLEIGASIKHDEAAFQVRAVSPDGEPVGVRVEIDMVTGKPEGESQAPHGAVRWSLFPQENDEKPIRLKMQWIYDLHVLSREVEEK